MSAAAIFADYNRAMAELRAEWARKDAALKAIHNDVLAWRFDVITGDGLLAAPSMGIPHAMDEDGIVVAECVKNSLTEYGRRRAGVHATPGEKCRCGLWGVEKLTRLGEIFAYRPGNFALSRIQLTGARRAAVGQFRAASAQYLEVWHTGPRPKLPRSVATTPVDGDVKSVISLISAEFDSARL